MSLFSTETLVGRLVAGWTRSRAIARLTENLERASDRRLADIGVERADIPHVAMAAYPESRDRRRCPADPRTVGLRRRRVARLISRARPAASSRASPIAAQRSCQAPRNATYTSLGPRRAAREPAG